MVNELLAGYATSSDDDNDNNNDNDFNHVNLENENQQNQQNQQEQQEQQEQQQLKTKRRKKMPDRRYIQPAPQPSITSTLTASSTTRAIQRMHSTLTNNNKYNHNHNNKSNNNTRMVLQTNPLKSTYMAPVHGPSIIPPEHATTNTKSSSSNEGKTMHHVAFDNHAFESQRTEFQRSGRALAPDDHGSEIVRGTFGHERRFINGPLDPKHDLGGDGDGDDYDKNSSNNNDNLIDANSKKEQQYPEHHVHDPDPGPTKKRSRKASNPLKFHESIISSSYNSYNHNNNDVEEDEILYGIWAPPSKETMNLQEDRMTTLQKVGNLFEELPGPIQKERLAVAESHRQKGILIQDGGAGGADGNADAPPESRENRDFDKMVERKMSHLLPPRLDENPEPKQATTIFHFPGQEYDYKGRSWMEPPSGWKSLSSTSTSADTDADADADTNQNNTMEDRQDRMDHHACYVPKKMVHRIPSAHERGIHRIRLFPNTGHLLLSAGLDGTCKLWNVSHMMDSKQHSNSNKKNTPMRTYNGHHAAVRDIQFNTNGKRFLSCSFDRYIRLWDTESGTVLQTFTNRRVPYVLQFYPKNDNYFVTGCSDNKIVAYDCTTGLMHQEYNHHLAPVNTITFVEPEEKGAAMIMVTSSDDKKVLVWEWDIGVPIKYISDPTMHSMPSIALHPNGAYLACSALDNCIRVYQAGGGGNNGRFAIQKKKKFEGHRVAGYSCDLSFSPDGRFLCSGDGEGRLFFWEWKRGRLLQKYRAHDGGKPTVGCVWHPIMPSVVFTCGWDGVIKMWE